MSEDLWVFGYGSLVWRPDFPFAERAPCYVEGWKRRFWQGSTDHRGVPGAPGRVVTLLPQPEERCWGTGYRIARDQADYVMAHLDYREKGGYRVEDVSLTLVRDQHARDTVDGLVYIATPENPNYLGPASHEEIADQVLRSTGPSGPNDEYILRLAEALREMGVDDSHVFGIEALVRSRRDSR